MPNHILIIGGGVIGAMSAYYLSQQGKQVTIVDRGRFGAACSHGNCGYICPSHVLPLTVPGTIGQNFPACLSRKSPLYIKPRLSFALMKWLWAFRRNCNREQMLRAGHALQSLLDPSRSLYEEIIANEQLACEWETRGMLFVYHTKHHFDGFATTAKLIEENFGKTYERIEADKLEAMEPALKPGLPGAWYFRGDALLRPDRLVAELRRVLLAADVKIKENVEVTEIIQSNGSANGIRTAKGEMSADAIVVATGAWTPMLQRQLGMKIPIQPGKGYSITMPRPSICPTYPVILEEHRVAITPMQSGYRIGSTMEFSGYDESPNPARIEALINGAKIYMKEPTAEPVQETWFGFRPMTPDSLPIIDRAPRCENLWLAVGHNMLGMSTAPATGKLLTEMMLGASTQIDPTPYSAKRF
jgi:D-amino-acid dehydrogenase